MIYEFIRMIQRIMNCFPGSFINKNDEIIVDRLGNSYFSLRNVKDEIDVGVKMLSALSRDAYKSQPFRSERDNNMFHARIKSGLEEWFNRKFSYDDLETIYTYLGNGIRNDLAQRFITEGNLDTSWLLEEVRKSKEDSV